MKQTSLLILLLFIFSIAYSQDNAPTKGANNKGKLFIYWGWNWDWYSKSNIHFEGNNYDFELKKVIAKYRQSPFSTHVYLNPSNITIPQYNLRIGYYFNNKYSISLGNDHMKYVMRNYQQVKINGNISGTSTPYDGTYSNSDITLTPDFLLFEHTDGLNYENIELRRLDHLFTYKNICITTLEGIGAGILIPRTNTTLLNNQRYDEFHLAGFGLNTVIGINIEFFKHFFIQTELKGGYINMPSIRTTMSKDDNASQQFLFAQYNVVIGGQFKISK